jgi:hypothetical protein
MESVLDLLTAFLNTFATMPSNPAGGSGDLLKFSQEGRAYASSSGIYSPKARSVADLA